MKTLFWFSAFFILYTYIGYGVILIVMAKIKRMHICKDTSQMDKMVSVVISVYNEELNIGVKLLNLLEQSYNHEKLEILIVSDGSTDHTNEIVENFIKNIPYLNLINNKSTNVRLVKVSNNQGKPNALNLAVSQAKGEIIVFSDVRQLYKINAIEELVGNFNDHDIGSVSGELVFLSQNSPMPIEMGAYWTFEKIIRKKESETGYVVGATGAIYAIRKKLFKKIPEDTLIDDVMIPMNVVLKGYRNIFDGKAIAFDTISDNYLQEKRRKVRTLLGNYQLIQQMPELLSPNKNPIFFRFVSHKLLRLLVPFFFITLLFASLLSEGIFYKSIFISIFFSIILVFFKEKLSSVPILDKGIGLMQTFLALNYFALIAFYYFIWPPKKKIW